MFIKILFGVLLSTEYGFLCTFGMGVSSADIWTSQLSKALTLENCGENLYDRRIVGGSVVYPGTYPWIVSMQALVGDGYYDHVCGASILNEYWMVTAAHCFNGEYSPLLYRFVAGINELSKSDAPEAYIYSAYEIIPHPNFTTYENDIALIQTLRPIAVENDFIGGVCLPEDLDDPTGDVIVSGWGTEQFGSETYSDVLLEVEIPMVDRRECKQIFNEKVQKTNICAGSLGKDACQSDSGGPLFQIIDGISVLVGLVSFGGVCGSSFPGVYTKISSYFSWMKDIMLY